LLGGASFGKIVRRCAIVVHRSVPSFTGR